MNLLWHPPHPHFLMDCGSDSPSLSPVKPTPPHICSSPASQPHLLYPLVEHGLQFQLSLPGLCVLVCWKAFPRFFSSGSSCIFSETVSSWKAGVCVPCPSPHMALVTLLCPPSSLLGVFSDQGPSQLCSLLQTPLPKIPNHRRGSPHLGSGSSHSWGFLPMLSGSKPELAFP